MLLIPSSGSSLTPPQIGKVSACRFDCPNSHQRGRDFKDSEPEPPPRLVSNCKDDSTGRCETCEHGQSDSGTARRLARPYAKDGRAQQPIEEQTAETEWERSGSEVQDKCHTEGAPEVRGVAACLHLIHPHRMPDRA
jgi:hypothetical protein